MKTILCILDGVGNRKDIHGNAVKQAETPNLNKLIEQYPNSLLEASGEPVGLPRGQMGNSEVGHMNIGAGRVVYQPLQLINKQIKDGVFRRNENLLNVMDYVLKKDSNLQICGLLSDGGIHSHINHLMAIIDMAKQKGITKVYYHMFLDGRDTLPDVAEQFLDQLDRKIKDANIGSIATISGRYYAMDRDNRWNRVERAYNAIVNGIGEHFMDYREAIHSSYEKQINDEFILPTVLNPEGMIKDNDGIIFFNYRPDRARELFSALTNEKFEGFTCNPPKNLKLVTMMPVSDEVICTNAFEQEKLTNTLGEYISEKGIRQLRIAETEKYAHVTYFFDGGLEKDLPGCKRILIPSPKVATYDLQPEMSANEITDTIIKEADNFDFIVVNYANGDMVGHTGNMNATIQAIEVVDACVGRLYEALKELDYRMVLTADHGNSDYMLDDDNHIITSHSTAPVLFLVTDKKIKLKDGKLGDIAPTILKLMSREIPSEMTGEVLIQTSKEKY